MAKGVKRNSSGGGRKTPATSAAALKDGSNTNKKPKTAKPKKSQAKSSLAESTTEEKKTYRAFDDDTKIMRASLLRSVANEYREAKAKGEQYGLMPKLVARCNKNAAMQLLCIDRDVINNEVRRLEREAKTKNKDDNGEKTKAKSNQPTMR